MSRFNVKKEFGATVRAFRRQLGISQETLAERAQLHRTYVTDVERGARNLSLESISRLANALELSISSLFPLSPAARHTDPPPGPDILLVEDDQKDLELALETFAGAGLSNPVQVACDGAAALDFLLGRGPYARRQQAPRPLIVLLDLHLPKIHGLEVLRCMRKHPRLRRVKVVILTNSSDGGDVREALELGAAAYIVKPLSFKSLSSVTPQLNFAWKLLDQSRPGARPTRPGSSRRSLK
jgi:CheY-like chemotaxis protein